MSQSFSGSIHISSSDFTLEANNLIVRENEIAFSLSGIDKYGEFTAEGAAVKTDHGFYFTQSVALKYSYYWNPETASIKFIKIDQAELSQSRKVEGTWIENPDQWRFSGNLQQV